MKPSIPMTKVDQAFVREVVRRFPRSPWELHKPPHEKGKKWELAPDEGGVYAFVLPTKLFSNPLRIPLFRGQNTPASQRPGLVYLEYDILENRQSRAGGFVAYVGRTNKLLRRLRWHLSVNGRSTAAQVRKGVSLAKCWDDKDAHNRDSAVKLIREHATIVFLRRNLNGLESTATRDALETALCAKVIPPFNIKAER